MLFWGYIMFSYVRLIANKSKKRSPYTEIQLAPRGDILDSEGKIIATSVALFSSYFYTARSSQEEVEYIRRAISRVLVQRGFKRSLIRDFNYRCGEYARKHRTFEFMSGELDLDIHEEIIRSLADGDVEIKDLRGKIYSKKNYRRFYPFGKRFGPILGYIDQKGNPPYGLERAYNKSLKGREGIYFKNSVISAVGGRWGKVKWVEEPQNGEEVKLTIDTVLQDLSYRFLGDAVKKYDAVSGCAVVIETETGKIRAFVNYPSFDPNNYSSYSISLFQNTGVSSLLEVGSVMKPLVIGYLMDYTDASGRKFLKPSDKYYCEKGKYKIPTGRKTRVIEDSEKFKTLDIADILAYSSNIGMAKIMQKYEDKGDKLGLYRYLISLLNLKRSIKIDIPGYQKGVLKHYNKWTRNYSMISFAIGHEISAPFINYVMAFNTIPAKGKLLRPLLKESDPVEAFENSIFSAATAEFLQKAMALVVDEGTGKNIRNARIGFAGKTGTARKWDRKSASYSKEKYLASFIGYFPRENPKYTIGVFVDEPRESIYGGSVAAPVFKQIAERLYHMELNKTTYIFKEKDIASSK